jgi:all-trans-8'-apo-beta-carotenal 15,15'-oxygenase
MFTGLQKLDVVSGEAVHRELAPDFPGEPLFVPSPGGTDEDDGWVLTQVYRAAEHRSDLLILDARSLETVCCLPLPHHTPPGFHSTWVWEEALSADG